MRVDKAAQRRHIGAARDASKTERAGQVGNEQLQAYRDLSEHADKQINRAWKAYAILAGLLAIGFGVLFGNLGSFKESVRKDLDETKASAQARLEQEVGKVFAAENVQVTVNEMIAKRLPPMVDATVSNRIAVLREQLAKLETEQADIRANAVRAVLNEDGKAWQLIVPGEHIPTNALPRPE